MPDLQILCPACQAEFTFSEAEQAECAEQAFPPPTFCPDCHRQRKMAKEEERDRQRGKSKRRRR